jgi:hypothetical protein
MSVVWRPVDMALVWGPVEFGGCVYALKFSDGTVKVGKSRHLKQRFDHHLQVMGWKGAQLVDFWFSRHHDYYSVTERLAIKAAESLMTPECSKTGFEYFHGIDFEELLALLQQLDPCAPALPPGGIAA